MLGCLQRIGERGCALAIADELDEIGDAPLFFCECSALELDLPRHVVVQPLDLGFNPRQDIPNRGRGREALSQGLHGLAFCKPTGYEEPVVTRVPCGPEAAVITLALAADLANGASADPAAHGAREEMRGMRLNVTTLPTLEASLSGATRPGSRDLKPAVPREVPGLLRYDPEALVHDEVPLGFGLWELAQPAGPRVAPCLSAVPNPSADVLFVPQDPAYRCRRPALPNPAPPPDATSVQRLHDGGDRLSLAELAEDPLDDGGLRRLDGHPVAVRAWTAATVRAHFADRDRFVAVRSFTHHEPPGLLPLLPAKRLLSQVVEIEFVDDAAHLEAEFGVLVVAVKAIGAGDDPHAVEAELRVEGEQKVVVPRQAGEVIDQDGPELPSPRGCQQGFEGRAILERTGLCLVLVDVRQIHDVPARMGELLAGADLIFNALGPLVVRGVASIDRDLHRMSSRGVVSATLG